MGTEGGSCVWDFCPENSNLNISRKINIHNYDYYLYKNHDNKRIDFVEILFFVKITVFPDFVKYFHCTFSESTIKITKLSETNI